MNRVKLSKQLFKIDKIDTLFLSVLSFDEWENNLVDLRIQPPSKRINCGVEWSVENFEKYRTRFKSVYNVLWYTLRACRMDKARADWMEVHKKVDVISFKNSVFERTLHDHVWCRILGFRLCKDQLSWIGLLFVWFD